MSAVATPVTDLRSALDAAVAALADGASPKAAPTLERPKQAGLGDYSTNAAMLLAPVLRRSPRDVAADLGEELQARLGPALERVEVAGPGFLNLVLADAWFAGALDARPGRGGGLRRRRGGAAPSTSIVEFVSANPTGPMHVGHARNAAYGDALARLLRFRGHRVTASSTSTTSAPRSCASAQSVQARARGEEVARRRLLGAIHRRDRRAARGGGDAARGRGRAAGGRAHARPAAREPARASGSSSTSSSASARCTTSRRRAAPRRSSTPSRCSSGRGAPTATRAPCGCARRSSATTRTGSSSARAASTRTSRSDIAYQQDKRERGYDLLVYVWGADHHGYQARNRAAWQALGGEPDAFELLIMQFVHLVERGERSSMSKRAGTFVTLDDLVLDIGVDAARWFLLQRSHDTTIDLDLDLAREQSNENPVYYVQYAHARIRSVLRKAGEERVAAALAVEGGPLPAGLALHETERALVKKLLAWPDEVAEAADRRAPHRVTTYALELAQVFTAFYRDCQVVGAEPRELEDLRLRLSVASRRTIARALGLLGVDAPDEM